MTSDSRAPSSEAKGPAAAALPGVRVSHPHVEVRHDLMAGSPVVRGSKVEEPGGFWRTFRALRPPGAQKASLAQTSWEVAPIMVKMFRSFEASIGGREIPWVRRRDQDIVKYLLLKPGGKASRAELAATFWGDTDRHLATQSVRTACSTIRKAIGAIVGPGEVDLYFRTAPDVQIDLAHVVCDVHRFSAHFKDAESCLAFGDAQGAAMHLRAADKLHSGDLLEFEIPRPWFAQQADALKERHLFALECLADLAIEHDGDYNQARQYAMRVQTEASERPAVSKLLQRLAFLRPSGQPRAAELQSV